MGIPPCDPLVIPRLELEQPEGANVGFDAVLTNASFAGGLGFIVRDFVGEPKEKGYFYLELNFPKLAMVSHYVARGKILIANFEGEGLATGEFGEFNQNPLEFLFGNLNVLEKLVSENLYVIKNAVSQVMALTHLSRLICIALTQQKPESQLACSPIAK